MPPIFRRILMLAPLLPFPWFAGEIPVPPPPPTGNGSQFEAPNEPPPPCLNCAVDVAEAFA